MKVFTKTSLLLLALALDVPSCATVVTTDNSLIANQTYDYVVVGGGLSGLTVANKLSSGGHTVLVIEAGGDVRGSPTVEDAESDPLPGLCNWEHPAYDEDGNELDWKVQAGACIGGSTSINGMVWYRPTEAEVNKLETLGNPGWNWATIEPYLVAIERNIPPDAQQVADGAAYNPAVHGFNGPVNTSFLAPMRIPFGQSLYKEAFPVTFPPLVVSADLSDREGSVSASTSWTIWFDGQINRRSSAADALLWAPSQQRPTLTLLAEHLVDKLILSTQYRRKVIGVRIVTRDNTQALIAHVRKEVILSAGTHGTTPILERSGVGDKHVLHRAGVVPLVHLPGVGRNLNDQPGTLTSALVKEEFHNDTSLIDNRGLFAPIISLVDLPQLFGAEVATTEMQSLTSRRQLMKRAKALVDAGAAVNFLAARAILSAAIDLIVVSKQPIAEFIGESYPTVMSVIFWPLLPLSRGHVHITSPDPTKPPHIVPRFLSDVFDQAVAVLTTRGTRALFSSASFSTVVEDPYYDPQSLGPEASDEEHLAWFDDTLIGASHWIGATSMLPKRLGGVVDSELRVYGVKNLRVVDAGILPLQITSHPMSLLYAIAQRGADLILHDA